MSATNNTLDTLAQARALYYDFFAGLFLYELLGKREELLLHQLSILSANAVQEADMAHFSALDSALRANGIESIVSEYTSAFLLPFSVPKANAPLPEKMKGKRQKGGNQLAKNPHIMLYLSHYVEGCINGSALLKAKELVRQSSFRLNSAEFKESEEHLGFLLLLMRHLLLSNSEDKALSIKVARELVLPLVESISTALIQREDLLYYSHIGHLMQSFFSLEKGLNQESS